MPVPVQLPGAMQDTSLVPLISTFDCVAVTGSLSSTFSPSTLTTAAFAVRPTPVPAWPAGLESSSSLAERILRIVVPGAIPGPASSCPEENLPVEVLSPVTFLEPALRLTPVWLLPTGEPRG